MLQRVREYALSAMQKRERVVAWIVDDTGFPKKGKESVGWRANTVVSWENRTTVV